MDKNHPVLSVIVPIYNVEKYLDKCIHSISRQTYKNLEIILVDDGSTDSCGEICDVWRGMDSRIKVIHKKNNGLVSARQTGLQIASGEYIAYVDSDDWIEEDMYDSLMGLAMRYHADMVTSGLIRDYENHSVPEREKISAGVYRGEDLNKLQQQVIRTDHFFDSQLNMHITNKIFKKDILWSYQMNVPVDARVGEDADVVYPYIFEAQNIAVSGKCFYHYVMRNDSIMGAAAVHKRSQEAMENIFTKCADKNKCRIFNIREQLSQVILFFACMTEPEAVFHIEEGRIFPFKQVEQGDKVILYGVGRFGKAVKRVVETKGYCQIVAWADKVASDGIILPSEILACHFDKLVLAVINATVADDIEEMLIGLGIEKELICRAMDSYKLDEVIT